MYILISLALILVGLFARDSTVILAAGLFGIAGAIEYHAQKRK